MATMRRVPVDERLDVPRSQRVDVDEVISPRYVVSFDVGDLLEKMPDDVCRRVIARRLAELEQELTVALITGLETPNVRQTYPVTRPDRLLTGIVRTDVA